MLPNIQSLLDGSIQSKEMPSKTYSLSGGMVDGLEAVQQAVALALTIPRYQHLIYSWNYGSELDTLLGKPTALAVPEIKRLVAEALAQDDRILGVDDFSFTVEKNAVLCRFTVNTRFGSFSTQTEVTI